MRSENSKFLSVLISAFVCFALALFLFLGEGWAQITCPYTLPDNPTDKDILSHFYCETDGDNWTDNTNWGSNTLND
ncbi:MAG: hypothetical protein F4Y78_00480 [Candidatus Dadabacteria bacterium]|nr:hypothetical protein [Candidatus Dadabacteria bacterium]MYA48574.1 hypothetical protein [Candidatus Dadabacteria bacterium]MYG82478.1 hypothetical protein [Candidatus Dadabacteria bacterium]MYK49352.1 hypothetical protein [Candidatus Dadabacteria bacterium]